MTFNRNIWFKGHKKWDFCMACRSSISYGLDFHSWSCQHQWHPVWCRKCWQGLSPVYRARSLPTPSFDSICSYTDFCLDFSCIGGGGATFQSPSLQPVQIKGIKNSWTNIRKANTKVVSAWFLLETYTKTSFQAAAARGNVERGYDNPMPSSCLTVSTPRKHHS